MPIKIAIHEEKKPEVVSTIPPREETKKIPRKKTEQKIASERKPQTPPKKKVEAVQGFNPSAVSPTGTGIAVPLGNTLMVEDKGKRLRADQVEALGDQDLSADPHLIRDSVVTPKYTDEALDANLQGAFLVEVFVDEHGIVKEAELKKKIGYGMDDRVLASLKSAKFDPGKNRYGQAIAAWTDVRFLLEIPN